MLQRNCLSINLAENTNIVLHDLPGIGKTTAMVISMIAHCNKNIDGIQVLCFVPTYEASKEIGNVVQKFSKYTRIKYETITASKTCPKSVRQNHILIGTPLELSK